MRDRSAVGCAADMVGTEDRDTPWLSILLPAYNVAPFAQQCLESIIGQSDEGVEIIVCEDCSTDDTLEVLERIREAHRGRFSIMTNERNRGQSFARNRLLDAARGDYIWFLDADDYLVPGAIASIDKQVRLNRPDMIGGDYRKRKLPKNGFSGPKGRLLTDRDAIVGGICKSRKMYVWLRICKRELWGDDIRFPDGKLFEDVAVVPWLALRATSMIHLPRALLEYRIHLGSSLSAVTRVKNVFNHERHRDLALALEGFPEALRQLPETSLAEARFGVSHFIAMEFTKLCERIAEAGKDGCGVQDLGSLARDFREGMEANSPIPFNTLKNLYVRRLRLISWYKLKRALDFAAA